MPAALAPVPPPAKVAVGRRIGLLGGSFNPAHGGHREITRLALGQLSLQEIWWLVSPQNPLKPSDGMATLEARLGTAQRLANGLPVTVSDVERELETTYTADTLQALTGAYPRARFVWLMGADNLVQVHRWQRWSSIFHTVPVAVFARPTYALRAEAAKAARRFARFRVRPEAAADLVNRRPPAWVLLTRPHIRMSATVIRNRLIAPEGAT